MRCRPPETFTRAVFTLGVLGLGVLGVSWAAKDASAPGETAWTMLDVNDHPAQADAHLLQMPDGSVFLVDVGDVASGTASMLRDRGLTHVDKVLISHPHKDHYGGLAGLLDQGIEVGELYMNRPIREVCDAERPWGCDFDDVARTIGRFQDRHIPVKAMRAGDVLYDRGATRLEVLYAFDGLETPVGRTDVNDTSVILLLTHGRTRALFTGDLNQSIGAYLARQGSRLQAQILKVPHHGAEGVAPNEFFDRVAPEIALASAPATFWQSDRDRRVREHLETMQVETLVTGLHGEVEVRFGAAGYTVFVEKLTPGLKRARVRRPPSP